MPVDTEELSLDLLDAGRYLREERIPEYIGDVTNDEGTRLLRIQLTPLVVTLSNGQNDNVDVADARYVQITGPTAAFSISGFVGGVDGRPLLVENASGQAMTILHQNAGSTDVNRIITQSGSDEGVNFANFIYSGAQSRWISTDTFTSAGAGAPTDASYLTLGANPGLSAERILTPGTALAGVDSGAGSPYTLNFQISGLPNNATPPVTAFVAIDNAGTIQRTELSNIGGTVDRFRYQDPAAGTILSSSINTVTLLNYTGQGRLLDVGLLVIQAPGTNSGMVMEVITDGVVTVTETLYPGSGAAQWPIDMRPWQSRGSGLGDQVDDALLRRFDMTFQTSIKVDLRVTNATPLGQIRGIARYATKV